MAQDYTIVVPRADRTGPTNLAVDLGRAAVEAGHRVRLLYLGGTPAREVQESLPEVRQWRWRDLIQLRGIIHTHGLRPDLLGWLLSWGRRRTLVTTIHNHFLADLGFLHARWKVRLAWAAWAGALARYDHRFCISATMQRYYRRKLPRLDLEVAYNFTAPPPTSLDPACEPLRAWLRAQREEGRISLAFVGALIERKNVLGLVAALRAAPCLALLVCGDGPLRDELEGAIRSLHLEDRVRWGGVVRDPHAVLVECDAMVLPSRAEGMPLVALEAARAGRPSILSNIAVHRELARLGLGTTIDHRRFTGLEAAARRVVATHGRGGRPSPRLRELWSTRFSPAAGIRGYAGVLDASHSDAEGRWRSSIS